MKLLEAPRATILRAFLTCLLQALWIQYLKNLSTISSWTKEQILWNSNNS